MFFLICKFVEIAERTGHYAHKYRSALRVMYFRLTDRPTDQVSRLLSSHLYGESSQKNQSFI